MTYKNRPVRRLIDVYEPGEGKAQTIDKPSQLSDILWRAARGELGKRNVAVTLMLFCSGMRINEVAQLKIKDIMYKNGSIKRAFKLPAKYTKTGKSRVVYIVVRQQIEALTLWVQQRLDEGAMTTNSDSYGNLQPDSPLFLSKKGTWRKFAFNAKKYKAKDENGYLIEKETKVCSSLENLMREIIKGAGIQGGSSHSGRRSLATWLDRKGCSLEAIQEILNHEAPDMTIIYIDAWMKRIDQAYKGWLSGIKIPENLK